MSVQETIKLALDKDWKQQGTAGLASSRGFKEQLSSRLKLFFLKIKQTLFLLTSVQACFQSFPNAMNCFNLLTKHMLTYFIFLNASFIPLCKNILAKRRSCHLSVFFLKRISDPTKAAMWLMGIWLTPNNFTSLFTLHSFSVFLAPYEIPCTAFLC